MNVFLQSLAAITLVVAIVGSFYWLMFRGNEKSDTVSQPSAKVKPPKRSEFKQGSVRDFNAMRVHLDRSHNFPPDWGARKKPFKEAIKIIDNNIYTLSVNNHPQWKDHQEPDEVENEIGATIDYVTFKRAEQMTLNSMGFIGMVRPVYKYGNREPSETLVGFMYKNGQISATYQQSWIERGLMEPPTEGVPVPITLQI